MRIECYNSHVHSYVGHLSRNGTKYYPLDGKYICLPVPDNARDIEDRLQGGCLFDDMVMETHATLKAASFSRSLRY